MKRRWTPKEDAILREHFHDRDVHRKTTLAKIAKLVDRTPSSVWYRARDLKLLGCPPGLETLEQGARRVGVDHDTLRKVLKRGGYPVALSLGRYAGARYRRTYVEPIVVDAAMKNWRARSEAHRDTPYDLGKRPGHASSSTIRRRLVKLGITKKFKDAPAAVVRECAFRGATLAELGALHGLTRNGVTAALRRAGLWPPPPEVLALRRYYQIDLDDPRYQDAIVAYLPTYRRRQAGYAKRKDRK